MKRLFAVLLMLALMLSLVACGGNSPAPKDDGGSSGTASVEPSAADNGGEEAAPLIGEWEYEYGGYTYAFKEDGSGTYSIGSDNVMEFTYEDRGDALAILYSGSTEPIVLEYILDGDTLNVKDSFGSDTIYKKK